MKFWEANHNISKESPKPQNRAAVTASKDYLKTAGIQGVLTSSPFWKGNRVKRLPEKSGMQSSFDIIILLEGQSRQNLSAELEIGLC